MLYLLSMRALFAGVAFLVAANLNAQSSSPGNSADEDRILGIIPNYQTVSDPTPATPALTPLQKWQLAARESYDPFSIATAGLGAYMSQARNGDPQYGSHGGKALSQRFGAAVADETSQNLLADGLLATWLHEDPRYFRKGPGSRVLTRIGYALSRPFVTRMDSGRSSVNWSQLLGTTTGIALSNAYYPAQSRNASVSASRLITSMGGAAIGNLLPEFWPDIRKKFRHKPGY